MPQFANEDEFRQHTFEKYRAHFDHVYALHQFAQAAMLKYRAYMDDAYKASLSLIFARAFKSFDSVRRLCEIAYCEDAAVVLRSLLNLLVVTRWISLGGVPRAHRYLSWYWVAMKDGAALFPELVPADWSPIIDAKYDSIRAEFEYVNGKGKKKRVKHWYEPDAHSLRDMFEQVQMAQHYEEAYGPLSGVEHSDATAFIPMVAQAERQPGERRLEVQSDMFVPHYLRNVFQYFGDLFRICNKSISLADPTELETIISKGMDFYRADMMKRGMKP